MVTGFHTLPPELLHPIIDGAAAGASPQEKLWHAIVAQNWQDRALFNLYDDLTIDSIKRLDAILACPKASSYQTTSLSLSLRCAAVVEYASIPIERLARMDPATMKELMLQSVRMDTEYRELDDTAQDKLRRLLDFEGMRLKTLRLYGKAFLLADVFRHPNVLGVESISFDAQTTIFGQAAPWVIPVKKLTLSGIVEWDCPSHILHLLSQSSWPLFSTLRELDVRHWVPKGDRFAGLNYSTPQFDHLRLVMPFLSRLSFPRISNSINRTTHQLIELLEPATSLRHLELSFANDAPEPNGLLLPTFLNLVPTSHSTLTLHFENEVNFAEWDDMGTMTALYDLLDACPALANLRSLTVSGIQNGSLVSRWKGPMTERQYKDVRWSTEGSQYSARLEADETIGSLLKEKLRERGCRYLKN